jgi:iron complex outermembrane receptor protein
MIENHFYNGSGGHTLHTAFPDTPYVRLTNNKQYNSGFSTLIKYDKTFSNNSNMTLQIYYDKLTKDYRNFAKGIYDALDIDVQHRFNFKDYHEFIWGIDYRYQHDRVYNSFSFGVIPPKRTYPFLSAFLQDNLTLIPDRVRFTLGSKFEHNSFTGFEFQPNFRLLWTPNQNHTFWGAISRAVRTPSRGDYDLYFPLTVEKVDDRLPPIVLSAKGNQHYKSETMIAQELGYRFLLNKWLFLDITTYYNVYEKLKSYELDQENIDVLNYKGDEFWVISNIQYNDIFGQTYGAELVIAGNPKDWWTTRLTYSYLQIELERRLNSNYLYHKEEEGESPHNQISFQSSFKLSGGHTLDFNIRYVDDLPGIKVPSYTTYDLRLNWHLTERTDITIVGSNLHSKKHLQFQFAAIPFVMTKVDRSYYCQFTWRI